MYPGQIGGYFDVGTILRYPKPIFFIALAKLFYRTKVKMV